MKMSKDKILNIMKYAGLSSEEFEQIKPAVADSCRKTLLKSTLVASLLLLALTIMTFFNEGIENNRLLYFVTLVLVCAINIAGTTLMKKNHALILPFSYVFLAIVFAFSIVLGVFQQADNSATTFCVLLFALPLLITDKPYRIDIFLCFVTAVFCVMCRLVKSDELASLDTINSISFLFLTIFVNYFISKSRFSDVLLRMYIERERDTDDLTKLLTKAAFSRETNKIIKKDGGTATLLIIDIDNFKQVNDTMGHAFGDAVLRIMGECIRNVFDEPMLRARFGGDEFVILMPGIVERSVVENFLQALISEMDKNLKAGDDVFSVTGSIGVAFMPRDADDYDSLFIKADEALYESKKKGKNCYTFYLNRELISE